MTVQLTLIIHHSFTNPLFEYLVLGDDVEHLVNAFLFEDVILFDELLVQPVGMFDSRDGIGDPLQGGRDGDDFGDRSAEPLDVVIPIQNT